MPLLSAPAKSSVWCLNPPFIPVSWVDDENILQDPIQLTLPAQPAYSISLITHRFFFFLIWRKSGPANYKKYMWLKKKRRVTHLCP